MRYSSAWVAGAMAFSYGLTPEQADEVFAVIQQENPAGTPSTFIAQFEAAAVSVGALPEPEPAPEQPVEEGVES